MEANKEYRLVVRGRGWYCNLPITQMIVENGSIVMAFNGNEFVGMFDLGAVDVLYKTEVKTCETG
jgi:hypothetical protein